MRAIQIEQQVRRVVANYFQMIITVLLLINVKCAHELDVLNAYTGPYCVGTPQFDERINRCESIAEKML